MNHCGRERLFNKWCWKARKYWVADYISYTLLQNNSQIDQSQNYQKKLIVPSKWRHHHKTEVKPDSNEFDNIKMEKDSLPGKIILSNIKRQMIMCGEKSICNSYQSQKANFLHMGKGSCKCQRKIIQPKANE